MIARRNRRKKNWVATLVLELLPFVRSKFCCYLCVPKELVKGIEWYLFKYIVMLAGRNTQIQNLVRSLALELLPFVLCNFPVFLHLQLYLHNGSKELNVTCYDSSLWTGGIECSFLLLFSGMDIGWCMLKILPFAVLCFFLVTRAHAKTWNRLYFQSFTD